MMSGMEIAWQIENDPDCREVLDLRWPDVPKHGDIKNVKAEELEKVDIITGGFPCQGFSVAGKRRGKADDRWLWPEMRRIIEGVRPRWVLAENVPGIIKLALDDVLSDLEALGYTTGTVTVPACAVGAPHRRERVWIVAYTVNAGSQKRWAESNAKDRNASNENLRPKVEELCENVAHSVRQRLEERRRTESISPEHAGAEHGGEDVSDSKSSHDRGGYAGESKRQIQQLGIGSISTNVSDAKSEQSGGIFEQQFSSDIDASGNRAGKADWWSVEPRICRVAHGVPNRVHRLKGLGNGQVTFVVYELARIIIGADEYGSVFD
jgi:DNA (cytosine-5)-methyltransferase 1